VGTASQEVGTLTLETAVPAWVKLEALRQEKARVLARIAAAKAAIDSDFNTASAAATSSSPSPEGAAPHAASSGVERESASATPTSEMVDQARKALASKQREVAAAYVEVEVELKAVLHRITDLRLVAEELEHEDDRSARVEAEIATASDDRLLSWEVLHSRRLTLCAALRDVYPIVHNGDSVYSIRGAKLPPTKTMSAYEEEEVSTALGYALHMVALLSKILQVPLRYFPELVGSRSKLRDDVMPHLGTVSEFPLYWRGVDQKAFQSGLKVLNADVQQLCAAVGLVVSDSSHVLKTVDALFLHLLGPVATRD